MLSLGGWRLTKQWFRLQVRIIVTLPSVYPGRESGLLIGWEIHLRRTSSPSCQGHWLYTYMFTERRKWRGQNNWPINIDIWNILYLIWTSLITQFMLQCQRGLCYADFEILWKLHWRVCWIDFINCTPVGQVQRQSIALSKVIRRHIRSVVTVICTVWGHEKYFRWQMTNILP